MPVQRNTILSITFRSILFVSWIHSSLATKVNGDHEIQKEEPIMTADTKDIIPCTTILSYARNLFQETDPNNNDPRLLPSLQLNGEFEHADFWEKNQKLLHKAWLCYDALISTETNVANEEDDDNVLLKLDRWIQPSLYDAVETLYKTDIITNSIEHSIHSHWSNIMDFSNFVRMEDIYTSQLLTMEGIRWIRSQLDLVDDSGIPTRRPNGMNRRGHIIDDTDCYLNPDDTDSYLSGSICLPPLNEFISTLVQKYIRPMGRMLFPKFVHVEDDCEMFAFTIRYDGENAQRNDTTQEEEKWKSIKDQKLSQHRDASVVTININLNLPEEDYTGSSLYFNMDKEQTNPTSTSNKNPQMVNVTMNPGSALFHRGSVPHGAYPIDKGTRHNLIIWLFGKDGVVRSAPYHKWEQTTVHERWQQT